MIEGNVVWRTPKDATTSSAEKQGLDYVHSNNAESETKGSGITPQSISSAGKDTQSSNNKQGSSVKNAESDAIPTDEEGNVLYERVPIERTIRDLFDGSLDDAEVKAFVAANVEAAQRAHDKISNKPPKISTNKQKYLEAKAKWQGQVKAAKEKLDYWNAVEAERQKLTHTTDEEVDANERELSGEAAREDYRNNADTNMEVHTAEDLARSFLHGAKITPESFREETGLGVAEQRKFVGMISNQGKSIAHLGEDLVEIDNTEYGGMFFRGDTNDARSAIIDALMGSYSRKDLKSSNNTFEDEYAEEIERQRDEWYYNAYHMTYEEYLQYESTIIPEYLRKYANFDEDYFYSRCHEAFYDEMEQRQTASNNENVEENGEQRNDTHREEQGITQSNSVLQGEEVDNSRGDSQSKEQSTEVPTGVRSSNENGTLPQSTPTEVDEPQPIGNSFFGKVYNQFKGKAKEAVNFLMRHKSGKLLGVFHRNDIGEISLVWGDEKGGLAHIISKHIVEQNDFNNIDEVINTMQQVINNGTITRENKDKVVIDYNDYRVAIRKQTRDNNGNVVEQGNWIVTAFDKSRSKKDKTPSEKTLSTPPFNQETDGVALPSNGVTASKVTQSSQTKQEKENKFSPTPRKDGESITDYAERVAEEHQAKRTLKEEEAKVDTNPTEAQKEAGNYKKGHIKVDGMDVTIEQPKGSVRRGKDADGKE